ncbi:unnamed protein product, partial [Pleuronectes platessa]
AVRHLILYTRNTNEGRAAQGRNEDSSENEKVREEAVWKSREAWRSEKNRGGNKISRRDEGEGRRDHNGEKRNRHTDGTSTDEQRGRRILVVAQVEDGSAHGPVNTVQHQRKTQANSLKRGREREEGRKVTSVCRLSVGSGGLSADSLTEEAPREVLSLMDDLFSGLGSACVVAGKRTGDHPHSVLYSVVFKCLEPDSLYKFTIYAVDSRGSHSESSFVSVRTSCPMVDDSRAEEIADKVYNLYNGYTSGKEQQMAYNTLMEVSAPLLYRVQHHYNSHYEKFGDFVWRSEDELGPRKANLILRRVEKISHYCRSLLRSTHIQSRTDTMAYVYCRSEEGRAASTVWQGSLHESRSNCMEKLISVQRNTYSSTKLR